MELRKWTQADAEALCALCNAIDRRYLSDRIPFPYTLKDAHWWLDEVARQEGANGIFRAVWVDSKLVGSISVEQKSDVFRKDAEIGYFLLDSFQKQGIMTNAVRQICDLAFSTLDLLRISAMIYSPNIASQRVVEKNSFTKEGFMKKAVFKNGETYDLYIYGKLKSFGEE